MVLWFCNAIFAYISYNLNHNILHLNKHDQSGIIIWVSHKKISMQEYINNFRDQK